MKLKKLIFVSSIAALMAVTAQSAFANESVPADEDVYIVGYQAKSGVTKKKSEDMAFELYKELKKLEKQKGTELSRAEAEKIAEKYKEYGVIIKTPNEHIKNFMVGNRAIEKSPKKEAYLEISKKLSNLVQKYRGKHRPKEVVYREKELKEDLSQEELEKYEEEKSKIVEEIEKDSELKKLFELNKKAIRGLEWIEECYKNQRREIESSLNR